MQLIIATPNAVQLAFPLVTFGEIIPPAQENENPQLLVSIPAHLSGVSATLHFGYTDTCEFSTDIPQVGTSTVLGIDAAQPYFVRPEIHFEGGVSISGPTVQVYSV